MTNRKTWSLLIATIFTFSIIYAAASEPLQEGNREPQSTTLTADSVAVDSVSVDSIAPDSVATDSVMPEPEIFQTGKATYYGNRWHGRKCASGERYNKDDYTCAHRTLPFGTLIKVTNTRNNKSAIVRVIDRGPFGKGKVIDLSMAAAKKIEMVGHGITTVDLQIIPPGTPVKDGEIVTQ